MGMWDGSGRIGCRYDERMKYFVIARSTATKQSRIYDEIAALPSVARNDGVAEFLASALTSECPIIAPLKLFLQPSHPVIEKQPAELTLMNGVCLRAEEMGFAGAV